MLAKSLESRAAPDPGRRDPDTAPLFITALRLTYADATALVTGASSGLGKCFAETVFCRGANVVLVARSASFFAKRLRAQYGQERPFLINSVSLRTASGCRRLE